MTSNDPVYSGLPFTYLSGQSPTETKPPVSPNVASKAAEDAASENRGPPEAGGFSYLTGEAPDDENIYDNAKPNYPGYTKPKEATDGRSEIPDSNDPGWEIYQGRPKKTAVPPSVQHDPLYDMVDSTHSIPRPTVKPNVNADLDVRSRQLGNLAGQPKDPTTAPSAFYANPTKPRPLSDDQDFNSSMRSPGKKGGCCQNRALLCLAFVVVALLCIGIGFVIGWFVKDMLEDSDDSTDSSGLGGAGDLTTTSFMETQSPGAAEVTVIQQTVTPLGNDAITTGSDELTTASVDETTDQVTTASFTTTDTP